MIVTACSYGQLNDRVHLLRFLGYKPVRVLHVGLTASGIGVWIMEVRK